MTGEQPDLIFFFSFLVMYTMEKLHFYLVVPPCVGIASPDIAIGMSRVNSTVIFLESEPLDRKIATEINCYSVTTVFINNTVLQCFCYSILLHASRPPISDPTAVKQCHGTVYDDITM